MQVPAKLRGQKIKAVQAEMASIVAAAVHQDWISVQEGVCDTLDCDAFLAEDQRAKYQQMTNERLWSAWVAAAYLDPAMPGTALLLRCSGCMM